MERTPDEIKKGLEYISIKDVARKLDAWEDGFPYDYVEDAAADALAYIQQLEAQNSELSGKIGQLEAERDAAVRDIEQIVKSPYVVAYCDYCKYGDNEEECAKRNCFRNRNDFEWRGVQKEE